MPKFTQTIIWTVLPNGASPPPFNFPGVKQPPVFNFSVLVSPRLFVDASDAAPGSGALSPTLELFPDFLDWPSRKVVFKVRFGTAAPVEATRVSPPPGSDLWRAVFRKTTAVRPYVFRRLDRSFIYSYPAAAVNEFLKRNYADLSSSDSTPSVTNILDNKRFGSIVLPPEFSDKGDRTPPIAERLKGFDEDLKLSQERPDSLVNQKTALADFLKLLLFHQPRTPKSPEQSATAVAPPAPDFHDLLAHLGEYPLLLRRLGLVIDLTVPAPANPADVVMLAPEFQPTPQNKLGAVAHTNVTPRTQYKASPSPLEFRALDQPDSDLAAGLLRLGEKERFSVVQIDADGAGLKAFNLANNLAEAASARKSADTPMQAGLPALRSGGIAVVRNGRAARFQGRMARAFNMNAAVEAKAANPSDPSRGITLTAPDLVRGYRVDVRELKGEQPGPWRSLCERDESYAAIAQQSGGPLKFAPQRTEGFVTASVGSRAESPAGQSQPPKELFLQETLFRWEGWSLCVRRPGLPLASRPEEVQKTIVEGQPDPPTGPPFPGKTIPLDVRFDVVPGSLPRLRFGGRYQLRARAVDLAGNGLRLNQQGEAATPPLTYARFEPVAPPRLLRGSPKKDGDSLERVVVRTGAAVAPDDSAVRHVAPPPVAQLLAETHGVFDGLAPAAAYALIKQRDHEVKNPAGPESSEKVLPKFPSDDPKDKEHLYLPDPAAGGVIVRIDGSPVENGPFAFYGAGNAWPDFRPLRIELKTPEKGGGFVCKLDPATRVLTVRLLPSQVVRLRLSSLLTKEDLMKMGVFRWILDFVPAEKLDFDKLLKGGISTINPFREVVLVHAVQQPLEAPQFSGLKAVRQSLGQTGASLSGAVSVHGASTVRVDVLAEWDELTGRGVALDKAKKLGAPEVKKGRAHVGELTVKASATQVDFSSGPAVKHEFGDTKHRVVRYTARGTTRFREYFLDELGKNPPPVLTRDSQPVEVKIPSSARPAAPKVQYVIPSFRWFKHASKGGDSFISARLGGGLRVYLDGPWFSSGAGELLGVVTSQLMTTGATPERLRPFVTQWGEDPIWKNKRKGLPAFMGAELFPLRVSKAEGLPLDEVQDPAAGESVNVAAHEVKFDGSRWYSDINLHFQPSPTAPTGELPVYFPFIRLALARYQPDSLPGVHLSRVTLADFAQLVPDRITYAQLAIAKAGAAKFSTALTAKLTAQHARFKGPSASIQELVEKTVTPTPVPKDAVFVAVAGMTHARAPQNAVTAVLQRATSPRKSELDWEAASPVVNLTFSPDASLPFIGRWMGKLDLPADFKPGSFRVLVSEAEFFAADMLNAEGKILQTKPSGTAAPAARVVYADTIEI